MIERSCKTFGKYSVVVSVRVPVTILRSNFESTCLCVVAD